MDVADPAQLGDGGVRIGQRLAMEAVLVRHRGHARALDGLRNDHRRRAGRLDGPGVGTVDGCRVVAVDLDRVPAERLRPSRVGVEIPLVHGRAGLAEAVDVDDGDEVVELVVGGVLECLPDAALRHLRVTAQHPDAVRQSVELLAGERHAHGDRQTLAQRAGRHVHPRQDRCGVALDAAAELAEGQHLRVADRTGRLVHRVQQRRRVALAEDQVVVVRVLGRPEVVVQVLRHQHRHQVGAGHGRGRVAAAGGTGGSDRVDAQLEAQLTPLLEVSLGGHACSCSQVVCRFVRARSFYGRWRSTSIVPDSVNGRPGFPEPPVRTEAESSRLVAHHPEAVGAVHRSRPRRAERHLGVLAASGADRVVHLAGAAIAAPGVAAACAVARAAAHGAALRAAGPASLGRRCESLLGKEGLLGRGKDEVNSAIRAGDHLIGVGH